MHFEGSVPIKASREKVWAFVIDPDQVGQCGPGVETIEVVDATHFKATAKVGIGFINARFNVDMSSPSWRRRTGRVIKAHGQAPGSAVDATAEMRLSGRPGRHDGHGLERRREPRRDARERRRAADRGNGQQDDRPDLRLHAVEARGLTRPADDRPTDGAPHAASSDRSPPTSTSSPTRARARRSPSTPRSRRSPGSPTSSPRATGRSS